MSALPLLSMSSPLSFLEQLLGLAGLGENPIGACPELSAWRGAARDTLSSLSIITFADEQEGNRFIDDVVLSALLLWVPMAIFWLTYRRKEHKKTVLGRAWFPSVVVASMTFSLSIRYAYGVLVDGFDINKVYVDDPITRFTLTLYIVFVFTDIGAGLIFYPKHLDLFSGWIHHTVYLFLFRHLLNSHGTAAVLPALFEELPTLILALGRVWPILRQDLLFGLSFLLTRILFQLFYAGNILAHYDFDHPGVLWMCIVAVLSTSMHIHWFSQWVKNLPKYLGYEKEGSSSNAKSKGNKKKQ